MEEKQQKQVFDQWLGDCCDLDLKLWANPTSLFNSWKRYADAANVKPGHQNGFAERLDNAGFEGGNTRAKGGRYRMGLALKAIEIPDDQR